MSEKLMCGQYSLKVFSIMQVVIDKFEWEGVSCGHRHQRVIGLNLESHNLEGSISPSIGNLSFLRIVNLSNNSFQGEIPCEMGRLFRLQVLDLNGNLFGGQIPASLSNYSNLRVLHLSNNKLIGNLPKDAFTQLVQLHMSSNNLLGSIPPSFGNLCTLKLFLAQKNLLEGSILDSLGSLKSLTYVSLSANKLTGTIPPSIYNISSLTAFEAPNNLLEGSLPQNLGLTSPNVKRLNPWGNQLSGSIRVSISNASKLEYLDLLLNNFSPGVVVNFGNLMNFSWLSLFMAGLGTGDANDLDFVSTLANYSKLSVIELQENNFGELHLNGNNLSGSIPREVIGLSSLSISLDLSGNCLTGPIPLEVGNLRNLVELNLSYNKLSGEIPTSLGSCHTLEYLYLDNNALIGAIPQSLSSLKGIEELGLSHNNLTGEIPKFLNSFPFLSIVNLSFNDLEGEIPTWGVFQNATAILVSGNNKLCGGIPTLQLQSFVSKKARKLIISIVCGVLGIIFALSVLLLCWLRKIRKQSIVASCLMDSPMDISYRELFKSTNGFSSDNLIGSGSFGSIYKGIFHPNEKFIAVKLLDQENRGASRSLLLNAKIWETLGIKTSSRL
ncbi:hypothetical protein ACSBR1_035318 [Camellia fascicularis]